MDPALVAALRPLAFSQRLSDLEARLTAAGAVEGEFDEGEAELIEVFLRKVGIGVTVKKRIRAAESHADDVVATLRQAKLTKMQDGPASRLPPLPGLRAGLRRFDKRAGGTATGMAERDAKEKDKWNMRFARVLSEVNAPVLGEMTESDMKIVVEM
jgi:hypothetical protein